VSTPRRASGRFTAFLVGTKKLGRFLPQRNGAVLLGQAFGISSLLPVRLDYCIWQPTFCLLANPKARCGSARQIVDDQYLNHHDMGSPLHDHWSWKPSGDSLVVL
jgi:hypothetical protein